MATRFRITGDWRVAEVRKKQARKKQAPAPLPPSVVERRQKLTDRFERSKAQLECNPTLFGDDARAAALLYREILSPYRPARGDGSRQDWPQKLRIAIEYEWERRAGGEPAKLVAALGRKFNRRRKFVRACISEYDALPELEPRDLLQMLIESSKKRPKAPALKPYPPPSKLEEAKAYLRDILRDGSVRESKITEQGKKAGHFLTTLKRAKKALGIPSIRRDGAWDWKLP